MENYDMPSSSAKKAEQVFPILVSLADNQQIESYIDIANRIGYKDARPLGGILGFIMSYCILEHIPCITRLVVSKATGLPGMQELMEFNLWRVFEFDWYSYKMPRARELDQAKRKVDELLTQGETWYSLITKYIPKGYLVN